VLEALSGVSHIAFSVRFDRNFPNCRHLSAGKILNSGNVVEIQASMVEGSVRCSLGILLVSMDAFRVPPLQLRGGNETRTEASAPSESWILFFG